MTCFRRVLLIIVFLVCCNQSNAQSIIDFSKDYERIFQIRVVSPDAGSKSSIGSGFQVSADGLIMTNYHVISSFVDSPDNYQIKYVAQDGSKGFLELLDFDVIADLAILRHPNPSSDFFKIKAKDLEKGETAYALGNPGDWGIIMVPGPTNGFVEHSFEQSVLFSGSLNPGMSGGPSLNALGEVVGVNVATAGSQLSFLVPAKKALKLQNEHQIIPVADYSKEIVAQIKTWQQARISGLLNAEWSKETFAGRELFGEIRHDFQCWGDTNESNKDRAIANIIKNCDSGDDIYISDDLDAGQISFSFQASKPIKFNSMQFARLQRTSMSADNSSGFEHSTNYSCETNFLSLDKSSSNAQGKGFNRVVTCIRAYKKLEGLYDSLLLVQHHQSKQSFSAHLSLSALEKDQINAINKRFVEEVL